MLDKKKRAVRRQAVVDFGWSECWPDDHRCRKRARREMRETPKREFAEDGGRKRGQRWEMGVRTGGDVIAAEAAISFGRILKCLKIVRD